MNNWDKLPRHKRRLYLDKLTSKQANAFWMTCNTNISFCIKIFEHYYTQVIHIKASKRVLNDVWYINVLPHINENPNATWVIDVKAGERVLYDVLGVGAVELLAEQR